MTELVVLQNCEFTDVPPAHSQIPLWSLLCNKTPPTANEEDKDAETTLCWFVFPSLVLLYNQMWRILLGRQASAPFSHGPLQPIDQCKSKVVTSGHDILWLVFESAYRSESLCTCRQKHWGRGLTHTARRFQLHVCICQGALRALPFMKTTSGTRAREAGCGLDVTGPLGSNPEQLSALIRQLLLTNRITVMQ